MRFPEPSEADAAISAITNGRVTCDDPDLDLMPDDPLGLIRYVRNHQRVPRPVLARDAGDALRIVCCLRADLDRAEHALIGIAREARVSWPRIAEFLGLATGEGAMLRHQRLESAIAGGPRSELSARKERKADLRRRQAEGQREGWALSHAQVVREVAEAAVATELPDEVHESAEEVTVALARGTPVDVWSTLRVLLIDMRYEECLDALPAAARHRAAGVLADWERAIPSRDG